MKLMMVVSGLTLACASLPAQAQETLDLSKITCDQFVGYKIINPLYISLWLSGYYNAKRDNTVIDVQGFEANARKLQDYCLVHSNTPVMQAVEAVFGAPK